MFVIPCDQVNALQQVCFRENRMPLLVVNRVNVSFGPVPKVVDASFQVEEGESVLINGKSGVGKTSLILAILGVVPIQSGDIYYRRRALSGLRTHEIIRLGIGFCPEKRSLFSRMSVKENMELGGYTQRDRWQLRRDIAEMCELFPSLGARMHSRVTELAGEEQQILAIARAFVSRPRLLLLDEPWKCLSQSRVHQLAEVISSFTRRGISNVIVAQHDHSLFSKSRAWVMEQGHLRQSEII